MTNIREPARCPTCAASFLAADPEDPSVRRAAVAKVIGQSGLHVIMEVGPGWTHTRPLGGSAEDTLWRGVPRDLITIIDPTHLALVEPAQAINLLGLPYGT